MSHDLPDIGEQIAYEARAWPLFELTHLGRLPETIAATEHVMAQLDACLPVAEWLGWDAIRDRAIGLLIVLDAHLRQLHRGSPKDSR